MEGSGTVMDNMTVSREETLLARRMVDDKLATFAKQFFREKSATPPTSPMDTGMPAPLPQRQPRKTQPTQSTSGTVKQQQQQRQQLQQP